jgi:hypothetical protein
MEPEHPKVDRAVLDFVKEHVFDPADFVIVRTAFAGSIRKLRGWWWRECRASKSVEVDVNRKAADLSGRDVNGVFHLTN